MFRIYRSKTGFDLAVMDSRHLHSQYNPEIEADRFISINTDPEKHDIFLIAGPGLGYILTAFKRKFTDKKVITIFYSSECYNYSKEKNIISEPVWWPGNPDSLAVFLDKNIDEADIRSLKLLEWPPAADIFHETANLFHKTLSQILSEKKGSFATIKGFSGRWFKNICENYILPRTGFSLSRTMNPVIIAASGPSLNACLPKLEKWRLKCQLWALPSSLHALAHYNIVPDLILETDPGYYAGIHARFLEMQYIPVIKALSSNSKNRVLNQPCLFFHQATPFELEISDKSKNSIPYIPAHGTVAGTALHIAHMITNGPIIFAGLDLCTLDVLSHIKPHGFDMMLSLIEDRYEPLLSIYYKRQMSMSPKPVGQQHYTSVSLETYAGWFDSHCINHTGGIFRLNPSPVSISTMTNLSETQLDTLLQPYPLRKEPAGVILSERTDAEHNISVLRSIVADWTAVIRSDDSLSSGNYLRTIYKYIDIAQLSLLRKTDQFDQKKALKEKSLVFLGKMADFLDTF